MAISHRKWRSPIQIAGYRARVLDALRVSRNSNYVTLDYQTAKGLVDICSQAIGQADLNNRLHAQTTGDPNER